MLHWEDPFANCAMASISADVQDFTTVWSALVLLSPSSSIMMENEGADRNLLSAAASEKGISAAEITKRVTGRVRPGSIVLFHNAALHTPEALPRILDSLISDGYTVVPISQLIYTGDYTIDHTGRQRAATTAEQPNA